MSAGYKAAEAAYAKNLEEPGRGTKIAAGQVRHIQVDKEYGRVPVKRAA
jgi:hypothetical protein